MPVATPEKIAELADRLFYERGFATTSFADIAGALGISRGNFYHHFKTKDAILDAVMARRLEQRKLWLAEWAALGPRAALHRFIDILTVNEAKIMAHGCPVGGLCQELARLNHAAQPGAQAIAGLFIDWLAAQLVLAGGREELARHLFGRAQGVAALANITGDKALMQAEVKALHLWLDEVLNGE
ncbi:TetR/AcrR family transcriptional regulator [Neogemmobacter tilapiae]|uniref:TetR family transcriptional regulator n=1 Tax=Neogemmobacter tilapiae TaxID=875041 RepID=A0A918TQV8_9RHOB|nr:TetR/AcrR family transcriptional regulator [Gemmobacter tilapiae]GHC58705.1 TetR family transcriptional regulator [Gemmobacter tilapiae]